jgi:hypothetical protein
MKIVMFGGAIAMLAGGFYAYKDRLFVPANVYAGSPAQIYQTLNAMQIERSPQGPMGTLDITKTGVAAKSITWAGAGAHAGVDCTATLIPLDPQRTRVETNCGGGGPSDGAAAGTAVKLLQIAMVEQIDSTLRGRPYNKQKVQMADAGAVMQGLPQMESDALKMQHDVQQDVDAANADIARRHAEAENSPPPAQLVMPGQPGFGQPGFGQPNQSGQPMLDPRGTDPVPLVPGN